MLHWLAAVREAILNRFWRYKELSFSSQEKGISCFFTCPHKRASRWRLRVYVFLNYQKHIQDYALLLTKRSGQCFLGGTGLFRLSHPRICVTKEMQVSIRAVLLCACAVLLRSQTRHWFRSPLTREGVPSEGSPFFWHRSLKHI